MVDKKLLEEWLRALPDGDDVYPAQGSQGSNWHGVELVSFKPTSVADYRAHQAERRAALRSQIAAQLANVPVRTYKGEGCPTCAQPGAPAHQASELCRSGRREHCSCDLCY